RVAALQRALLRAPGGSPTDVEGPHRELGSRLTDGLGGNHSHRLADAHLAPAGEVTPVALHADASSGLASQHAADFHAVQPAVFDLADSGLVDLLIGPHQHLARHRVVDVVQGDAAEDALAESFDDFSALDQGPNVEAVHGAAVV